MTVKFNIGPGLSCHSLRYLITIVLVKSELNRCANTCSLGHMVHQPKCRGTCY